MRNDICIKFCKDNCGDSLMKWEKKWNELENREGIAALLNGKKRK